MIDSAFPYCVFMWLSGVHGVGNSQEVAVRTEEEAMTRAAVWRREQPQALIIVKNVNKGWEAVYATSVAELP